jgi:hypothetical protein
VVGISVTYFSRTGRGLVGLLAFFVASAAVVADADSGVGTTININLDFKDLAQKALNINIKSDGTPNTGTVPSPSSPSPNSPSPTSPSGTSDSSSSGQNQGGSLGGLKKIADQHSDCGGAPIAKQGKLKDHPGFYYGVVDSFARSMCRPNDGIKKPMLSGAGSRDAINKFDFIPELSSVVKGKSENKDNDRVLIATYSILLTEGMLESNGNFREGRDVTAKNQSSDAAEAGLFQTSNDIHQQLIGFGDRAANDGLLALEKEYERNPKACMTQTFSEGMHQDKNRDDVAGSGARFQKLLRSCPALAVEHAAITIRHYMGHYGPIKRGTAKPGCEKMLSEAYDYVNRSRGSICPELLGTTRSYQSDSSSDVGETAVGEATPQGGRD